MWPEIIVIANAVAVLLLDLFIHEKKRVLLGSLAAIGLAAAFASLIFLTPKEGAMLGGRFVMDAVAWWFKLLFIISGLVTVLISIDLLDGRVGVRVRGIGSRGE
jgi:NADH:ubiquinone oxidoreductase subunit 2 (subunit N)